MITNKFDEICAITDVQSRVNQFKSIFPTWDNVQLHDLADIGCSKLALTLEEIARASSEWAFQSVIKTLLPTAGMSFGELLLFALGAFTIVELASWGIKKMRSRSSGLTNQK